MVDRHFADDALAALYDGFATHRRDHDFYLELVMPAASVLDVGCGTGTLLRDARERGHRGRLCGLDPAPGMLRQARRRADVEWVGGDATSASRWPGEFELAVMSGHAFQVLLTDLEVRAALAAVRTALAPGGRFAFETRNPSARAWERWTPEHPLDAVAPDGSLVQETHRLDAVDGEFVAFTSTFTSDSWEAPVTSSSTLRFLPADALDALLADTGFDVEEQYGDWDRSPLGATSPEIITVARRRG